MVFSVLFLCLVCVAGDLVNFKGQCRLDPHPSVEYRCLVTGAIEGERACGASEPAGTIVSPRCRRPNYYASTPLTFMQCFDGYWDYIARCTPECGRVTPDGKGLVVGGNRVKRGELPWHAGIYNTQSTPYMQICGGSLVSNNVVLSAAHCFWTDLDKQQPASMFAVAVGKLYRPWNDMNDQAQKSLVKAIHLPERYQGASANYQDDIAVVIVARQFQFKTYIRPVCLSFDYHFEKQQLYSGNKGKVAGWGLVAANGKASPVLQVVDLPYVEVGTCINKSPPDFREYITSDKICAGTLDSNTALCRGDSGGGLAFPESIRGIERYYLRGIVSTAPTSDDACNTDTYTSFTSLMKHEHFIKQFWSESGQFKCQDGSFITAASYCDGTPECPDGSDETVWACAAKVCSSYLFQCKYGACVDRGATCNGNKDCADGSDEDPEMCQKQGGINPVVVIALDTKNGQGTDVIAFPGSNEVATFTAESGSKFRSDFKYYPQAGGYLKVHPAPADWETARLICKYEGAEVATPSTPQMMAIIKQLVASSVPKHSVYFAGVRNTFGVHANVPINGVPLESLLNNWDVDTSKPKQCLAYSSNGTVWDSLCEEALPYMCYRMYGDEKLTECGTVDPEYKLNSQTGSCYKLHSDRYAWEVAAKICVAEGGHLAIINSALEAKVVGEVARGVNSDEVAIGFRRWGSGDAWWTVRGQTLTEAGYKKWCNGCPDSKKEKQPGLLKDDCGGLIGDMLDSVWCDVPYPFVCEKRVNSLSSDKELNFFSASAILDDSCHGGLACSFCKSA